MSPITEGSSSRSGRIMVAFDATKNLDFQDFRTIISNIKSRGDILLDKDTITVFGILHKVLHPLGFKFNIDIGRRTLVGAHTRAIKEEVSRKVDACVKKLQQSAEELESQRVDIEAKIVVGSCMKEIIVREIAFSGATWAVLDRQLPKELKSYCVKNISCKVAMVFDDLSIDVLRTYNLDNSTEPVKPKYLYSMSKPVSLPLREENDGVNLYHAIISPSPSPLKTIDTPPKSILKSSKQYQQERNIEQIDDVVPKVPQEVSGHIGKLENGYDNGSDKAMTKEISIQSHPSLYVPSPAFEIQIDKDSTRDSNAKTQILLPDQSADDYTNQTPADSSAIVSLEKKKMYLDAVGCNYSEIKNATDNFSSSNILGEDGYGVVYKGRLSNGKLIVAKVQKEGSIQGFAEFHSQVYILSLVRHKNIIPLLAFCGEEDVNVLVYEYICSKSLEWHLFDNMEGVLEWRQRYSIAIGVAEALRFLHEECWSGPIIHQDMMPSNILITHEYEPLLGDFGLAKWKTDEYDTKSQILGTLGYWAPEYTGGTYSLQGDVFGFGIVLIQLISGKRAVASTKDNNKQSLKRWALQMIETLDFDEFVDPRLGNSYCTYEVYNMSRAVYMCTHTNPENRPTISEVLRILEGENDHRRYIKGNLFPIIITPDCKLS